MLKPGGTYSDHRLKQYSGQFFVFLLPRNVDNRPGGGGVGQHNSTIGPHIQLQAKLLADIPQLCRTEPTISSGIPCVRRPRCNATKCYSSPLLSVETFMELAPSRISEHVAGPLLPTLTSARATVQALATLHSVGRYSHWDMNHTVIASHDITSFDIINSCFVCKLKQTCGCKYIYIYTYSSSQKHVEILLNHNNQSRRMLSLHAYELRRGNGTI